MPKTAMATAFERAGITKSDMRAFAAAQEFIEAGGTEERWLSIYRQAASKLRGGGQNACDAPDTSAPSSQPNGEHFGHFGSDNQNPRANGSPRSRDGHRAVAAHTTGAAREPSVAQRTAATSVARTIAITVLDTYRVRDGRAIGDVRFGELERMRSANAAEASLLRQIQRHATAGHDQRVRDVVKAEELQRMIQRAAEVADAS